MFRLVKILNSSTNTAETARLGIGTDTDVSYGCAMKLEDGLLVHAEPHDLPEYISHASESSDGVLSVIPVTEAMLFETRLHPKEGETYRCGDAVALYIRDGKASGVCPDRLGKGEIVEISDTPHTVFVKFTK